MLNSTNNSKSTFYDSFISFWETFFRLKHDTSLDKQHAEQVVLKKIKITLILQFYDIK